MRRGGAPLGSSFFNSNFIQAQKNKKKNRKCRKTRKKKKNYKNIVKKTNDFPLHDKYEVT